MVFKLSYRSKNGGYKIWKQFSHIKGIVVILEPHELRTYHGLQTTTLLHLYDEIIPSVAIFLTCHLTHQASCKSKWTLLHMLTSNFIWSNDCQVDNQWSKCVQYHMLGLFGNSNVPPYLRFILYTASSYCSQIEVW